jgi:spermidine synthase
MVSSFDAAPVPDWLAAFSTDPEVSQRLARVLFVVPAVALLFVRRARWLFAGIMAGLLVAAATVRTGGDVIHRERTFFGVHQVTSAGDGAFRVLTHGTTTHGIQATRGRASALPTAYYHPTGPLGDIVFALSGEGRFGNVAVVGLGAGAVAGYAGDRTRMEFFEIDDAVIRIASDPRYFTYLEQARARPGPGIAVTAADGRVGLRDRPAGALDLILVDAFSSDAIPVHLMTREAVELYMSRVNSRGVVAFHVSSRFFDLAPVLSSIARNLGLVAYVRHDDQIPPEQRAEAKRASTWVILARQATDLGSLAHAAGRWNPLVASPAAHVWTDDYADVIGALSR